MNRIRRVLMTSDTVGGVWTYALDLCRAYASRDIEVLLATMGPAASPGQRAELKELSNVQLAESTYRLEWMEDPFEDLTESGKWLLELESQFRPDVVHLNGYAHGSLQLQSPSLVVAHSCVLSWWQAVKGECAPPAWDGYREIVCRGMDRCTALVAPTHVMSGDLQRNYGLRRAIRVIHNGVDTVAFNSSGKKEPFVFAAGRLWDEAKNLPALQAVSSDLEWPIYVAGSTEHPCGRRSPQPGLHLLGRLDVPAIRHWYCRASVFAAPAKYEPFGLAVLEAALSGCALVLGDIPSLRELWDGCALFVAPRDVTALQSAIQTLSEYDSLRERMRDKSLARAAQYNIERCSQQYLELYRNLCGVEDHVRFENQVVS